MRINKSFNGSMVPAIKGGTKEESSVSDESFIDNLA